jgi:eukaryotic-like serine/threonine-protein kinase
MDGLGLPQAATGQSAIVFHASLGSQNVALRCFTRGVPGQRARYQALHAYLMQSMPSYMVESYYRDHEILVAGERYPLVQMGWADGMSLDKWVKNHLKRSVDLAKLASTWLDIVNDMLRLNFAHGDLANDNCLVKGSSIKLIDYDGCYIPALAGEHPDEAGNPHFQHPKRSGYYAANIDAFPSLVIYLSLLALSKDSELWKFHTDKNLIFTKDDYQAPSRTPIWRELAKISNPRIVSLAAALADMCEAPIDALPPLSHLVTQASLPPSQQRPWWQTWPAQAAAQQATQGEEPWWKSSQSPGGRAGTVPAQPPANTSWLEDQFRTVVPQGPRLPPPATTRPTPAPANQPTHSLWPPQPPVTTQTRPMKKVPAGRRTPPKKPPARRSPAARKPPARKSSGLQAAIGVILILAAIAVAVLLLVIH